MPSPDFIIAGTQKGGTTWLEHNLLARGDVATPRRQLHFFDENFARGVDWYEAQMRPAPAGGVTGEKTTEYFDPRHADLAAERIAQTYPDAKVIVVLRDPAKRALSALRHVVNSGLEPIPANPDALLFADEERPVDVRHGFVTRGYYALQLAAFRKHIPEDRLLVLIFEEDIVADPVGGFDLASRFLGLPHMRLDGLDQPVNELRLSAPAIRMSRMAYGIPKARGLIRRADAALRLPKWKPAFGNDTLPRLREMFASDISELEGMLGRNLDAWRPAHG